nr:MAG TPA: hypothetical protein [Caudoviricetes sp.]
MHIPRKPSPVLSLDGYASSIIIEITRTRSFPNRPTRDSSSFQAPRWDSNQILMILILLWLHLQFQKSGNHVETLEG